VLASLPSPSENHWGPFHFYGLCIALGVFAAVEIATRRWHARGGDPDDMWAIAIWAVPAGLIGARIYHLITDWRTYIPNNVSGMVKVWDGGLGIPGGIIAGVAVGVWVGHRRGMRLPPGLDAVAPGMAVAQAIGRWGNWFNQELFGRPTSLPWGLRIDLAHRPVGYAQYATFHPTFLYESLWNFALAGALVLLDRKRVVRPGRIFALYIGGYAFGRFFVEALRVDHASLILGIRVNIWVSAITVLGVAIYLALRGLRRRPGDSDEPYVDGHRFSPDTEAADADADTEADEVDGVDSIDEGFSEVEGEAEPSAGEQGG
jgi:prolipoprotein diacylglyceryl transferase